MRNLTKMQNIADQQYIIEILQKFTATSTNKELMELRDASARQLSYVTGLEIEREAFDRVIDILRDEKHKAIYRARAAEKLLQEQAEEIEKLKKQLALFV